MNTTLIIPALDEEESIGVLVSRVPPGSVEEVIVVDNGSADATAEVAARAGARVVREPRRGYGRACRAGIEALHPDTEIVVFFDGDGSQRPEELSLVLAPIAAGKADFVLGSRSFGKNHPLHAVLGTRLVAAAVSWRYQREFTDIGPYRAIRTGLLKRLDVRDPAFGWSVEMLVKAAALEVRIVEVPVSHEARIGGRSKVSGTLVGSLGAGSAYLSAALRVLLGAS